MHILLAGGHPGLRSNSRKLDDDPITPTRVLGWRAEILSVLWGCAVLWLLYGDGVRVRESICSRAHFLRRDWEIRYLSTTPWTETVAGISSELVLTGLFKELVRDIKLLSEWGKMFSHIEVLETIQQTWNRDRCILKWWSCCHVHRWLSPEKTRSTTVLRLVRDAKRQRAEEVNQESFAEAQSSFIGQQIRCRLTCVSEIFVTQDTNPIRVE